MATLCKNCNHALVFEPALGKLYCAYCGSQFAAEDVESDSKKYRENERVLTRDEVFGDDETYEEFLESYVYTCSECGGEISIHGTEVLRKSECGILPCGKRNDTGLYHSFLGNPRAGTPICATDDIEVSAFAEGIKSSERQRHQGHISSILGRECQPRGSCRGAGQRWKRCVKVHVSWTERLYDDQEFSAGRV